ncbi:Retrovirus-related Pol polyprotein from transposon TNT 1-94 [Trichinella zimbabwensis]|uniref:Retrovirus-related Pol polyprotein from transposon TNT 1-94 n=1 Tax=Trichinella zimbabwensis TaxID=268475 RepID=A0A0V1H2A2_9BILA|nr:Retrovirus-related Pol polyprotein from transposon TNT 1-94 [Trichinella zimbabwensis]
MNTTVKIELLGKENYDTWKLQAQAILDKNDLWEFDDELSLEAALKWDISDQKAKADLILTISPLELREIKDCETSNEIWLRLASIYESKGPARKAALLECLILNRMNDEQSINDFLRKFFNCVDKLKAVDLDIAFDLLSILLLYSIPGSYESFRIAIESRAKLPKREGLKIKLLEEYEARKNREPKHDDGMFARGNAIAVERKDTWRSIADQTLLAADLIRNGAWTQEHHLICALTRKWELERLTWKSRQRQNKKCKGFEVIFQKNSALITNSNFGTVMVASEEGDLYYVESPSFIAATAESKVPTLMEWDRRLGHLNEKRLLELTKNEKSQTKKSCRPLELIHTDICGPMRQSSIGGLKYFITFIDDHSQWCKTYFFQNQNEVLDAFMNFNTLTIKLETKLKRCDQTMQLNIAAKTKWCGREKEPHVIEHGEMYAAGVEVITQLLGRSNFNGLLHTESLFI